METKSIQILNEGSRINCDNNQESKCCISLLGFLNYAKSFFNVLFSNNMESMNSSFDSMNLKTQNIQNDSTQESSSNVPYHAQKLDIINNWWAMLALVLVLGTAAGNILVCLAIAWERRLQNVTNYFLMSLAITDLMVAILVMPLGILTLVRGKKDSTTPLLIT